MKFWISVLTDLRNRGLKDVLLRLCRGCDARPTPSPTCGRDDHADLNAGQEFIPFLE
jgi:hypothetical protein